MGTFNFECKNKKCSVIYEVMTPYDETGKYKTISCPDCGSKKKKKLVNSCNHNFTNPVGSDRWNSESKGHDYRYWHNAPNVAKQREFAEQNSHMGTKVYDDIDDISSGEHEGKNLLEGL